MRRPIAAGLAAAMTFAGPVLAQTTPPATTTPPAATGGAAQPATPGQPAGAAGSAQAPQGMQTIRATSTVMTFISAQPADVVSSNLIGVDLRNAQNENIGEIEDLVIENGKTVRALVVGIGGFLGLGERYVAIDPASVTLTRENGGEWRGVVNTTREELQKAPEFQYKRRT